MATPSTTKEPSQSSIRVRYEDGRSTANAAAQHLVKPFASLILKPGKDETPGSPRLTPHKDAEQVCRIKESKVVDTLIYTFENPLIPKRQVVGRHKLYYFAGGGFRDVPEKEHWLLCAELGMKLPEYEFNPTLAQKSTEENFRITLMGDSSGGNIALVLGLYAASEYLKNSTTSLCPVETVMAISPATDLRNENPEIDVVDPRDPILSRKTIEEVALGWKGKMSSSDPRISPILADLGLYRKAGIKVDGITVGNDVLSPDGILFRKKLAECRVKGDWLKWEKQMHCCPLLWAFHVREGIAGKDWILEVLKANLNLDGSSARSSITK